MSKKKRKKSKSQTPPTVVPKGQFAVYGSIAQIIQMGLFQRGDTITDGVMAYVLFNLPDGVKSIDIGLYKGLIFLNPGSRLPASELYPGWQP